MRLPLVRRRSALAAFGLALTAAACVSSEPTTPSGEAQPGGETPATPSGPPRVGLLLPLSGDTAPLGRDFLDAAQMALFDVGATDLELLPRDTGATPETAARAAQGLIDGGAEILLGPLFGTATRAVAPVAEARGVPVLSFSNDASVAGNGVWVLGFRPEEQIGRVVGYAASQGLARQAALAPDDAYGDRAIQAWKEAVGAVPGAIAVVERQYAPDPSAMATALQAVATTGRGAAAAPTPLNRGASGSKPAVAGPPAFDALLLADGGQRLASLMGLLGAYAIDPAQTRLLGTLRWQEDQSLVREPAAQGAWLATWSPVAIDRFVARFRTTYGREPAALAVLAYDATALGALLAKDPERYAAARLTDPQGFAGASGLFRLRPDGLVEHGLAVVQIRNGNLITIDEAPQRFQPSTAAVN